MLALMAVAWVFLPSIARSAGDPPAEMQFFEKNIRPILAANCFECHGDKKQKGGLRLDNAADFQAGGNSGAVVAPGKLEQSLLIEAIRHTDPDFAMPPEKKLSGKEIGLLEKWVQAGAVWPQFAAPQPAGDGAKFSEEERKYWAFQPLSKPAPPQAAGARAWVRNEVDAFIAEKHTQANLTAAAEADRHELVRRVYFDLHGLPPTAEQAAEFVNDRDPGAYEKLLDRLLASPRYGERWAQHWLDLVRFSESDGYNQDAFRPAAWPYRDWVIQSFNADMPYDQFVKYQLAGDELAPGNVDDLVATSFLRNGIYEYNLRDIRGQWDAILNDTADVVGEAFLGLSFSCARCHNHKFDPILQTDYYRLRAFFEPMLWRTDLKLANAAQLAEHAKQQAGWEAATREIRAQIDAMVRGKIEAAVERDRKRFPEDIQLMVRKPDAERTALERQYAMMAERMPAFVRGQSESGAIKNLKTEAEKKRFAALQDELAKFDHLKPPPLLEAFVATDAGPEAPPTQMKGRRGEQEVQPGFLAILHAGQPEIHPLPHSTGRRTALAHWITRPDNPLSTRVIANRIWQYHFGRGIAGTANDLGRLGEKPTHPELLDWLARRFVASGWSFKQLHRLIMTSATYRQTARRPVSDLAAKVDPTNTLLWRFSPLRLDAEQVRDAMLLASGEVDLKAGGPSEDANSSPRRTIYTIKKRNSPDELLRSLDAPAGFSSSSERQRTTTATQALLMLNGDWPRERARRLAAAVHSPEEAWQRVFGRKPSPGDLARASQFLDRLATDEYAVDLLATGGAVLPDEFKPDSPQERLEYTGLEREGEDFSVEAIVQVESYAPDSSVRTIASRWNGGRNAVESCG
ncbi:MAG: hypothetical protein RIQ93_2737, partial [Verrucomicrobiota bacterium]